MEITLNGETVLIDDHINIDQLLAKLQLSGRLAVEINQKIIPRSLFSECRVVSGDQIEIIAAVGGG